MDLFAETLVQFVLGVVWWIVLFPILWVVATPAILVIASFQREPYAIAVQQMYSSVTHFWIDYGMLFLP